MHPRCPHFSGPFDPISGAEPPVDVFLTVDTEWWPRSPNWRDGGYQADVQRDFYGETPNGHYGVPYQIEVLNHYGLKGVFLIEALFPEVVGLGPLQALVDVIQRGGQDAQLHLHTEWLSWIDGSRSPLPGRTGRNLKDFTADEQTVLIERGLRNLKDAGAKNVNAFRAGNYGGNFDTLIALQRNGIACDTTHNTCYLDSACGMRTSDWLLQPRTIHGVREFPVTFFSDYPGHMRHAQLCACSFGEMKAALLNAWRRGWTSFVIVSHSFELIRNRKKPGAIPRPDPTVIRRFENLCRFLQKNSDKFQTRFFGDIDLSAIPETSATGDRPLASRIDRTAWRLGEQLIRRFA